MVHGGLKAQIGACSSLGAWHSFISSANTSILTMKLREVELDCDAKETRCIKVALAEGRFGGALKGEEATVEGGKRPAEARSS